MSFKIENTLYQTEAEIRYAKMRPEKNDCLVGVKFLTLTEEETLLLNDYVLEQHRKYFTKSY